MTKRYRPLKNLFIEVHRYPHRINEAHTFGLRVWSSFKERRFGVEIRTSLTVFRIIYHRYNGDEW